MPHASQFEHSHHRADGLQAFWTIFVFGFVVIFTIASLASLLGINWRNYLPGAQNTDGLLAGVKAVVYTFMSHIT
jgi:hypothetical protein